VKLIGAFKPKRGRWKGWIEENPAINTEGDTLNEARENLKCELHAALATQQGISEKEQPNTTQAFTPKRMECFYRLLTKVGLIRL
jgi:hypothetical protein